MERRCRSCGSDRIIPDVPLLDHYGDWGGKSGQAAVEVHGAPDAWVFKDTGTGGLSLQVCGDCGHADLRVGNYRELYAKYQQTRGAS